MTRPKGIASVVDSQNPKTGVRIGNARKQYKRFHRNGRQIVLVVFMLFALMGSGIGYVWSNFERTQIGYDVSQLKREEIRLKEINQKLRLEIATLKSPQRLQALAVEKLGLQQPTSRQIVVIQ
jgi:cell division protein FtsL